MDRKGSRADQRSDWGWLPSAMPGVAQQMATQRARLGVAWVNTCWRRGVVNREPGWFFAAEGPLTLGEPTAAQVLDWFDPAPPDGRPVAMLCLAEPSAAHAQGGAQRADA